MQGKCIGLFRGTSKSGRQYRVATMIYDNPPDRGFGCRSEEVFLPDSAPDPILNRMYLWSYNKNRFCDSFIEIK